MALFRPERPPFRGRSAAPGGAPPAGSSGSAAGTAVVQGFAPFGDGSSAGTSSVTGAGASIIAGTGTSAGTGSALGISNNIFPLVVSSDGRYLKQTDGTPFLICADTTWSLAVDIPLAGVSTFLNTIVSQGFNAVMMNVIEHHYTTVKPPKERGGNLPFTKRLDGTTFTGSPNGTSTANGTQGQFASDNYSSIGTQAPDPTFPNNTYWQAVETILNACLAHNVAVFVWPGYLGFHADDEGWMSEMEVWDGITGAGGFTGLPFANSAKSKMWNYGAWLADRWKNYPHLIWVMGGDYGSNTQTLDTSQMSAVNNLMAGLKSVAGQASTFFTAHWDRPALATDTTLAAGSFDLNLCYCDEAVAELARRGYSHSPTIPTFIGEYFYENDLFGGSTPYRKYVYWGFLGGIAGGFFGNEQLWRFDNGSPGTDYTTLLTTQATLDASRQFAFWKVRPWWRLKPSGLGGLGAIVTAGGGTASPQSTDYVAAAATSEGDLLLAYVPPAHTGTVTIDLTKMSATAQARWFDPANATFTNIGGVNNTGARAFATPGNNSAGDADWLLVLETVAASASGTGTATAVGSSLATITGTSSGTSTVTAGGQALVAATGSAAGIATATAVYAATISGAGASSGIATVSAVGAALATTTGASSGTATVVSTGAPLGIGVGSSSGVATATSIGSALSSATGTSNGFATGDAGGISTVTSIGSIAGTATASAIGSSLVTSVGSSAGVSTVTAVGQSIAVSTGTVAGIGSATATGASLSIGTGSSTGTSSVTGEGAGTSSGQGTGLSIGQGTATAVGISFAAEAGSAAGISTVTGIGVSFAIATGSAAGTSTASAIQFSPGTATGSSSGVATVSGVGNGLATLTGSAIGISTVLAVGTSIATCTGIAQGVGTVSGISGLSPGSGAGISNGISTVLGIGSSLAFATGISIGSAVVSGISTRRSFQVPVIQSAKTITRAPTIRRRGS